MIERRGYIATLRDGRAVYLDGGKIEDVTAHPAYARAVRSVARLYDFQAAPGNSDLMTYDCGGGARANRIWELPQSYEALVKRRRGLEAWTRLHCGFIGRAPDHVASCISGMYMGLDVFAAYDRDRAAGARGLLSLRTRQRSLSHLRDHQSAGRSLEIRGAAEERIPHRRRGRPRRERPHRARRQDARHRRHHGQRGVRYLHPAARARRREIRALIRDPDEREGAEDPLAQILRGSRAVGVRQSVGQPLR